jgi:mannose-6-phosphate isomerase-like protein (cupin superfamily)
MADVTIKRVGEMESIFYGSFKRAGAELEVGSFGMNVIDFPPDAGEGVYPDHDHTHDDQEEVYVAWRGSGILTIEGEEITLDGETVVRVGPEVKRKVRSGPDGMRLLVLGGVPALAYDRPERFRKGAADPADGQTTTPGPIPGPIPAK